MAEAYELYLWQASEILHGGMTLRYGEMVIKKINISWLTSKYLSSMALAARLHQRKGNSDFHHRQQQTAGRRRDGWLGWLGMAASPA